MSDNLEKMVFLEMTNKSMLVMPNKDYFGTYSNLSEEEKLRFSQIAQQIHDAWNAINSPYIQNVTGEKINSIEDYDNQVAHVDLMILKCANDFGVTLKREISPEYKKAIIDILGREFFDENFGTFDAI